MTSHRRIVLTGLIVVAITAAPPALAMAGSLLSGYGGPGQGSQAILGSALLGGGSGGDGGSSGGGPSGGGTAGSGQVGSSGSFHSSGSSPQTGSAITSIRGVSGNGTRGAPGASGRRGTAGVRASDAGANTYPAVSAERAYLAGAGSGMLGLSVDDLLYVLLALVALVLTGVLTRRLVRPMGTWDTSIPQGTSGGTRVSQ
jgi:hypothetical protein